MFGVERARSKLLLDSRLTHMGDPELLLVAEIHGLAGSRAELHGLLSELAQRTRGEQGCASFRVLSQSRPGFHGDRFCRFPTFN